MDLRLGLSLLLLLTYFSSIQSKNTRDGPNLRQRHAKRATLSEFLQPPAPTNFIRNHPPRNLAPPPPPPPPPPSSLRTGRYVVNPSPEDRPPRGYFSRLLGWLNPWSSGVGLEPPPQSFGRSPAYQEEGPPSKQNGPFQNEKSCNPCNEVPWIPIRGFVDGPPNFLPPNLNILRDGYYQHTPSQEVRQPDFSYSPNLYPGGVNPLPNPQIYPGVVPPLYKSQPFAPGGSYSRNKDSPENDFHHGQETENSGPSDSGGSGTNIQEIVQVQDQGIKIQDDPNQEVQVQENLNEGGQEQSQNQDIQAQTQRIQETNLNQGIQQQNQNQGIQQQNQNQGTQQQNQNQWIQMQAIQNQGIQEQNRNQGVPIQDIQSQGTQEHQNQVHQSGNQFQTQSEIVPSIGGQISSVQIHFEKSPLIDLTISSTSSPPLTYSQSVSTPSDTRKVPDSSTRSSSLIDYLVSSYDDRIPTNAATGSGSVGNETRKLGSTVAGSNGTRSTGTGSDLASKGRSEESYGHKGYNENQPFVDALMESYYNFKKEEEALNYSKASSTNSASSGSSGEDFLLATPSSRAVKRNKQVQIIIPYTAENTPSRFQSFEEDISGRALDYHLPRKVSFRNYLNHYDDNVVAQESKTVAVTSLPDISSTVLSAEKGKNNSIDVQRLQKNIDNWTIQEYSSVMRASTVLPNLTRPYLSQSKKIPNEYFTTVEPKHTSDETYDFGDYKKMSSLEISKVTQASTQKTSTTTTKTKIEPSSENPRKFIETKKNGTGSYPLAGENNVTKIFPVYLNPSTTIKDDQVYVVTPVPIGQKESKKAVNLELKKKSKKKDPEKVERAYQVLPQAVNNLAVVSTGPERVPLWGIMEHEEFAATSPDHGLPILYAGHSRVSYSRR
ncbi:uncharacterized protein LOC117173727 [Belonocnema kinseyi]|uniref:uncharacterized protein LOC117173727 n=1 Tax=Belonocnema kinseyi TaxID=2817044 RepID=UPI00143CEBE4|nr:uncharacterized protein LOC117173727 [Belonocnema kinseyi]